MNNYEIDKVWGTGTNKIKGNMTKHFGSYWKDSKLAGGWNMPDEYRKAFDGKSNKIFGGMK